MEDGKKLTAQVWAESLRKSDAAFHYHPMVVGERILYFKILYNIENGVYVSAVLQDSKWKTKLDQIKS